MNRIKINLPDQFHFYTEIKVRITDLNYGGHVGNDVFLALIHEARQQFLMKYGYTELSFEGIGLIMVDAILEYKKELNYGDTVRISVCAADFDKLGFDLFYNIELIQTDGLIVAGKAKTGMICYDYTAKKKTTIPEKALHKLQYG
ncbi:MAG: thioesterase family protein [Chitinophagaceae bacterium]|nr:thioesterase family protein [Chitinophagaceae bacterium]